MPVSMRAMGSAVDECVFCEIVAGRISAHIFWEAEDHIAFLSHRPNTEGFTVVATRHHLPSYAFDLEESRLSELVLASRAVARLLDERLDDVGRTGLILEGFGVDHAHAKLFPMHGTNADRWAPIHSHENRVFEQYEGFISSHDAGPADPDRLAALAARLRS
jgi:histidine triad (HIT) family protein